MGFLLASSASADISTFTTMATSLLTWMITSMGTVLQFMLTHPIALVGLVLSLIGTVCVYLRAIIGG